MDFESNLRWSSSLPGGMRRRSRASCGPSASPRRRAWAWTSAWRSIAPGRLCSWSSPCPSRIVAPTPDRV